MRKILVLIFLLIVFLSHYANSATKLFSSGFESATAVTVNSPGWPKWELDGTDATTGFNWSTPLSYISVWNTSFNAWDGLYNYVYTYGDYSYAEIVADPEDSGNKVLHFIHTDGPTGDNSRLSLSTRYIYDSATGFHEGYVKYRMRFSDISVLENIVTGLPWFTLFEMIGWRDDNPDYSEYAFSLDLFKDSGIGQPLYWSLRHRDYEGGPWYWDWETVNTTISVPIESWFTLEMYIKIGGAGTGKVKVWITPDGESRQTLFDIPDGCTGSATPYPLCSGPGSGTYYTNDKDGDAAFPRAWQVFKLYMDGGTVDLVNANGGSVETWYDDFEYWDAVPDVVSPTTAITTSDPQSISVNNLTVTGTASDDVGVSGCKWRIGAVPDASNGTACTGTTSWTCSNTNGYSNGANTLYVGCYDAGGNYGPDSITVNLSPPTANVFGVPAGVGFSGGITCCQ